MTDIREVTREVFLQSAIDRLYEYKAENKLDYSAPQKIGLLFRVLFYTAWVRIRLVFL